MKQYFESKNVKVFPCAYRGHNASTTAAPQIFDPEARLNTEYNLTHTTETTHESYIIGLISASDSNYFTLKFVIAGYRFEISDCTYSDFLDDAGNIAKIYIKTKAQTLYSDTNPTYILGNWRSEENSNAYCLDYKDTDGTFYFYGLQLATEEPTSDNENIYKLEIFSSKNEDNTLNLNYNKFLPKIDAGSANTNNSIILGGTSENNTFTFTNANSDYNNQTLIVDAAGFYSTVLGGSSLAKGSKAIATGINTIAEGAQAISGGSNTLAKGENSIALGDATIATEESSLSLGKSTQATAKYAISAGNSTIASGEGSYANGYKTKASGKYSHALGNETIAGGDYQVVIGKFNKNNSNNIFEVGNGTSTAKSNAFEVSDNAINLNCNTTINGTLTQTDSSKQVTFAGNIDANKGIDITKANLTLDDNSAIFGSTTTDRTTITKGDILSTGTINAKTTLKAGDMTNGISRFTVDREGNVVTYGAIDSGKIEASGLTVKNNTDLVLLNQKSATGSNCALQIDKDGKVTINTGLKQDSPTTNGLTTEFIDTVSQNYDGKINATKKKFTLTAGENQGSIKLNDNEILITNLTETSNPKFKTITTTGDITLGGDVLGGKLKTTSGGGVEIGYGAELWLLDYASASDELALKITTDGKIVSENLSDVESDDTLEKTIRFVSNITQTPAGQVSYKTKYFTIATGTNQGTISVNDIDVNIKDLQTTSTPTFSGINVSTINTTSDKFYVKDTGQVTALKYTATSDKRLKENINVYNPKNSILDLPVYKYDFINGPKNQIGCLAQDLQEICPEIVDEDTNGYLNIQESKLTYLLLNEVKNLRSEVKALKEKLGVK